MWRRRRRKWRRRRRRRKRRRRRRRKNLFGIVHARGAIANEMGPTRCHATPCFDQSADDAE